MGEIKESVPERWDLKPIKQLFRGFRQRWECPCDGEYVKSAFILLWLQGRERITTFFSFFFFCYYSSEGFLEPTTYKYITLKGVFKVRAKLFHFYSARRSFLTTGHFTKHSSTVYRMNKSRFIFPQENNL